MRWCTSSAWRASRPRPDSPLPLVSSISASRNRAHCGTRQAKIAGGAFGGAESTQEAEFRTCYFPLDDLNFFLFPRLAEMPLRKRKEAKEKASLSQTPSGRDNIR